MTMQKKLKELRPFLFFISSMLKKVLFCFVLIRTSLWSCTSVAADRMGGGRPVPHQQLVHLGLFLDGLLFLQHLLGGLLLRPFVVTLRIEVNDLNVNGLKKMNIEVLKQNYSTHKDVLVRLQTKKVKWLEINSQVFFLDFSFSSWCFHQRTNSFSFDFKFFWSFILAILLLNFTG